MKFWPTRKQWRYWSLPSRHTTAGLAVGVVGISLTVAFGILAIVFWLYPRVALDPASEAVLKSSNPTLLKLESAKLDTWLGDPEPYLTLVFKNVSEHAASDFSWDLVGEEGLMSFSPSQSAAPFQRDNLAVNPSSKMSIPVAAVSELYTELNINELDHIVGAGLTPNIPKVLVDRIHAGYPAGTVTSVRSYAFGVSYQYDDIFGDKSNTLTGAFVYVDNTRFQANEAVQGMR